MLNIVHRIGVEGSTPEDVYAALTTNEGLAGWWTTDTTGDHSVGGVVTFTFHADGETIGGFEVKVVELVPGKQVSWSVVGGPPEWIGTTIDFELRQEDDFTIVLFKHDGWREQPEFMYHCSTKWATFLVSLKGLVETGTGSPAPNDLQVSNWH